jgi:hypothetical protein
MEQAWLVYQQLKAIEFPEEAGDRSRRAGNTKYNFQLSEKAIVGTCAASCAYTTSWQQRKTGPGRQIAVGESKYRNCRNQDPYGYALCGCRCSCSRDSAATARSSMVRIAIQHKYFAGSRSADSARGE